MLTRLRVPAAGGAVALVVGVVVVLWGNTLAGPGVSLVSTAAAIFLWYLVPGMVLGAAWPEPSWAWGVWLILPIALLLLLSLAFSGNLGAFVRHDLVPLVGAVLGATSGGMIGAWARTRFFDSARATGG